MTTEDQKKRRGRKPSGLPPDEVSRLATKNRRNNLIASGKSELKTFVGAETKPRLEKLKKAMELATVGEVVDILAQQEIIRRNIS